MYIPNIKTKSPTESGNIKLEVEFMDAERNHSVTQIISVDPYMSKDAVESDLNARAEKMTVMYSSLEGITIGEVAVTPENAVDPEKKQYIQKMANLSKLKELKEQGLLPDDSIIESSKDFLRENFKEEYLPLF